MTIGKKISLERGSSLLRHAVESKKDSPSENTYKIASDFISRNEQGKLRVFVAGGSRSGKEKIYVNEAFKLGEVIGRMNYRLDFGLSSKGIMGAVAKGLIKAWTERGGTGKTPIYGITTKEYLALYQSNEVLEEVSKIIVAATLEERKQQLLAADFVVFAPGGVGTLDELVYDCVAMQDGFLDFKPFVLFNVKGFFHHLLEYLKEINNKGFSESMPFIVVDNSLEAGIAFTVLAHFFNKKVSHAERMDLMEKIIYELPYVIAISQQSPKKPVEKTLAEMEEIINGKDKSKQKQLHSDIENAYLNKEIERMYERLAKTGVDTAVVSHKLTNLKKRNIKK